MMSYGTYLGGEIRIEPPIPSAAIVGSALVAESEQPPFRADSSQPCIALVRDDNAEALYVAGRWDEDSYDTLEQDLQELVDAFPGHTFVGDFQGCGEENDDMWRVQVVNRTVVTTSPVIIWPEPGSTVTHTLAGFVVALYEAAGKRELDEVDNIWHPGPVPPEDLPHQQARAEGWSQDNLAAGFTADEVECLLRTLAELYDGAQIHDLSHRQYALADQVRNRWYDTPTAADRGSAVGPPPPPPGGADSTTPETGDAVGRDKPGATTVHPGTGASRRLPVPRVADTGERGPAPPPGRQTAPPPARPMTNRSVGDGPPTTDILPAADRRRLRMGCPRGHTRAGLRTRSANGFSGR